MQDVKAATWNKRQNARGDFVGIVSPDFRPALDAKRLSAAREKQPQIIVNLRGSRNSRTRVARGIFLPNGHRRSDAGDFVDIRFFHALEKLARVRGQRFDVAALALRVNGVEGERGFSGAADARDHGNGVVRNFDADIFEVVDAGAADADRLLFWAYVRGRVGNLFGLQE